MITTLFFPLLAALPAIGTGLMVAGTVAGGIAAMQGASAQKDIARIQKKQADLQSARQRRDAVRATRLAYAVAQQTAENKGASGSSASLGGLGSITSQGASDVSFLDQMKVLGDQGSMAVGKLNDAKTLGSLGSTAQSAGGFLFNNADDIASRLKKAFGG